MMSADLTSHPLYVRDLISWHYDIYTLLFNLHVKADHAGVREYLMHKLYEYDDEEIAKVMPQLCHLYLLWSPDRCNVLGDFFTHLCSHSTHLTLQLLWHFRAAHAHCTNAVARECVERLVEAMHMSLVNASVMDPDGKMRKREPRKGRRSIRNTNAAMEQEHSVAGSQSIPLSTSFSGSPRSSPSSLSRSHTPTSRFLPNTWRDEEDEGSERDERPTVTPPPPPPGFAHIQSGGRHSTRLPASGSSSSISTGSDSGTGTGTGTIAEAETEAEADGQPHDQHVHNNHATAHAAPHTMLNNQTLSVHAPSNNPASTSSSTSSSNGYPSSMASSTFTFSTSSFPVPSYPRCVCCTSQHADTVEALYEACNKRARADYFANIQSVMDSFVATSETLVKLAQEKRNKRLRKEMKTWDQLARGLYFPTYAPHSHHYRILRFLPSESFVLNSRDKAPFLFHIEVQRRRASVYDSDVYRAYRSSGEMMMEALAMLQCQACTHMNTDLILKIRARAERMQHLYAAGRIDVVQADPNPRATLQAAQSQAVTSLQKEQRANSIDGPDVGSSTALLRPASCDSEQSAGSQPDSLSDSTMSMTKESHSPPTELQHQPRKSSLTTALSDALASSNMSDEANVSIAQPPTHHMTQPAATAAPNSSSIDSPSFSELHTAASCTPSVATMTLPSSSSSSSFSVDTAHLLPLSRPVSLSASQAATALSMQAWGEPFAARAARIQRSSPFYSSLPSTSILSLIFKHGDDVRQEELAMQTIRLLDDGFKQASLPLQLTPYCVMPHSGTSGIIETLHDCISIDSLKKNVSCNAACGSTLASFFHYYYSLHGPAAHAYAVDNFVESMAAYAVATYLLQVKDRHNGNLMLGREGRIIHIDFGFILAHSPGGNIGFESAPFKLNEEMVQIMGGEDSAPFAKFQLLVIRGYLEARKHAHKLILLLEILSKESRMPCWGAQPDHTILALKERFKLDRTEEECVEHAHSIIEESINNWRTEQYDKYQRITNGIV